MSQALHPAFEIFISLLSLGILIWPTLLDEEEDFDAKDFDRIHLP